MTGAGVGISGEVLFTSGILSLEPESSSWEVTGAGVGMSGEVESSSWEVMGAGVGMSGEVSHPVGK